jgi:hypothetical protein
MRAAMTSIIRQLIEFNVRLSSRFDALLPERYQIDGNRDFHDRFCLAFIKPGFRLVDVGGGKNPYVNPLMKSRLGLYVTGLDINQEGDRPSTRRSL